MPAMNSIPKEYNLVIGCAFAVLVAFGGSLYFAIDALNLESDSLESVSTVSQKIEKLNKSTIPPTPEYLKALESQKSAIREKIESLQQQARKIDIPMLDMSPEDFQKALNQKAQSIAEKAAKESIQIPTDFYLDFNQYLQKLPSKELTPFMGRQLSAVGLLLDILLESLPIELKSFERKTADKLPEYTFPDTSISASTTTQPTPPSASASAKSTKKEESAPKKASLSSQNFELAFSTRPERLRTFLNAVSSEQGAFFIVRDLKISTSKQKGPLKNTEPQPGDIPGNVPDPNVPDPIAAPSNDAASPYIVGEEHIDVRMSIDLVALAPVQDPAAPKQP
jgi:hypothetical protein